ncbi:MAG: hypothetical protein IKI63_00605 [Clostridia bacterium]|nr:hypothetical protein [Clostridia bacterium]
MNPSSLTPAQAHMLLRLAEQRLGATPEQLEQMLKTGSTDAIAARLSPDIRQKLGSLLRDRDRVEYLLASPEIRSFLHRSDKP